MLYYWCGCFFDFTKTIRTTLRYLPLLNAVLFRYKFQHNRVCIGYEAIEKLNLKEVMAQILQLEPFAEKNEAKVKVFRRI